MSTNTNIEESWDIIIQPKSSWFDLNLKEVYSYRDLIWMFIKRDFVALYKQTILGPLWFVIQPLMITLTYTIVFGNIAHLNPEGQPKVLFYLSGIICWNYFSTTLLKTSETFSANAGIFGKVYFPRLTVPVANVLSSFISFGIQFTLFIILYLFYVLYRGYSPEVGLAILWIPVLLFILASLSLGSGLIISALTTKYRDLKFVVSFGIQLLMYAAPVVYPLSKVSNPALATLLTLNPLTAVIETFRYALLGSGTYSFTALAYSLTVSILIMLSGIVLFTKTEKNFIDTI